MGWEEHDARKRALERVHKALIAGGVLVPSRLRGAEARLWTDYDLASLVENRAVHPEALAMRIGIWEKEAAAREYARLLGGEVELDSAPGEGSTFSFRLPGVYRAG